MKTLLTTIGLCFEVLFNILALNLIKLIHKLTIRKKTKISGNGNGGIKLSDMPSVAVPKDVFCFILPSTEIHKEIEAKDRLLIQRLIHGTTEELTEDEEMNALIDYKMQEITLNKAKDIINE